MKRIKLFFVALLTCLCCVSFTACDVYTIGLWLGIETAVALFGEDTSEPTLEERRMEAEVTEGAQIVEVTQNEEGMYLVKAVGAIKNLGEKEADTIGCYVAFYDENGYLLDTVYNGAEYMGVGDTYKVECEAELFYEPATARILDVWLYEAYDASYEKAWKEAAEALPGETFACSLGEDGLYHATVTGQVKLLKNGDHYTYVYVAFYDANGYLYVKNWVKEVTGPAERTYTVECASDVEILSYKVLYAQAT